MKRYAFRIWLLDKLVRCLRDIAKLLKGHSASVPGGRYHDAARHLSDLSEFEQAQSKLFDGASPEALALLRLSPETFELARQRLRDMEAKLVEFDKLAQVIHEAEALEAVIFILDKRAPYLADYCRDRANLQYQKQSKE